MRVTDEEIQTYLKGSMPVIWAWIWTELKPGKAKDELGEILFEPTEHLRDLTVPWIRMAVITAAFDHPEFKELVRGLVWESLPWWSRLIRCLKSKI